MRHRVLAAVVSAVLSGLLLGPATAQTTAPDAETLRARMTAATGPANENYQQTIAGTGDYGDSTSTEYYRGNDTLLVFARGPILTMSGSFHGADWNRDANGITVADDPDPVPIPPIKNATTVQRVSATDDAFVLSVLDPNGFGERDVIDPATYLVRRHDVIDAGGTASTTYGPYARFGTQTLAQSWTTTYAPAKRTQHFARTSFALGKTTADDVAVPPVRQLVTVPPATTSIDLHADFDETRPRIPVVINGKRFLFMLGTEYGGIGIDAAVATQLGLTMTAPPNATPPVRGGENRTTFIPTIDVSGIQLHDVVTYVTSIGSGRSAQDPAGILGFDFLAELEVQIDYQNKRITATDPRKFQPPPQATSAAIPIRLGSHYPVTNLTMDGAQAERVVLGTETDYALLLFPAFAARHPDLVRAREDTTMYTINVPDRRLGMSGSGAFHERAGTVTKTLLGPFTLRDTDANVVTFKASFPSNTDAVVGGPILALFTVDFDYAAGTMYLTPNRSARKR